MRPAKLTVTEGCAARAEERDLGEKHCFGNANVGICGDQVFFGLMDVRPTFEQLRGKPGGQLRRQRLAPRPTLWSLNAQRHSPRNIVRILSQEDIERVLGLADLPLAVRDLFVPNV